MFMRIALGPYITMKLTVTLTFSSTALAALYCMFIFLECMQARGLGRQNVSM